MAARPPHHSQRGISAATAGQVGRRAAEGRTERTRHSITVTGTELSPPNKGEASIKRRSPEQNLRLH